MRTSSRECLPAGSNVSGKRPGRQETEVPKEWSNAIAVTTRFLVVNANWLQLSGATRQTCRFTIAITCGLNCKSDDSRGSPIPACMRSHPGDGSLRLRPGGGRRIGPEGRNLPFWRWAIYRALPFALVACGPCSSGCCSHATEVWLDGQLTRLCPRALSLFLAIPPSLAQETASKVRRSARWSRPPYPQRMRCPTPAHFPTCTWPRSRNHGCDPC